MKLENGKIFKFTNLVLSKKEPFLLNDLISEEFDKNFCKKRLEILKENGLIIQSGSCYYIF